MEKGLPAISPIILQPPKEAFVYTGKEIERQSSNIVPRFTFPKMTTTASISPDLATKLGKPLYYSVAATLLTLFLVDSALQVKVASTLVYKNKPKIISLQQVRKLTENKVTVARSVEPRSELPMPAISFCPGFKREALEGRWPLSFGDDFDPSQYPDFPRSKEEMMAAWDEAAVRLEDLVIEISFSGADGVAKNKYKPSELLVDGNNGSVHECVHFEQHDTFTGRCFSLVYTCPVPAKRNINVLFNTSSFTTSKLDLHFHHPGAFLGLNGNFWPGPAIQVLELDPDVRLADFALTRIRHTNKDYRRGFTEDDFYACVNRLARKKMKKLAEGRNSSFCLFPSMGSLAGDEAGDFSPCTDLRDYYTSTWRSFAVLTDVHNSLGGECPRPGSWGLHSVSQRRDRNAGREGVASAYFYYDTTDVTVEEEYLLVDNLSFVAAVGGTMGILLGWSILDVVKLALKKTVGWE